MWLCSKSNQINKLNEYNWTLGVGCLIIIGEMAELLTFAFFYLQNKAQQIWTA